MNPLVSILVASYNKAGLIPKTIASVLTQTYADWELLIVDDNSSDATVTIATEYAAKEKRIKIFPNSSNHGANYCRNYALKQAAGHYIIFLDADDLLDKTCLENRVKFMQQQPALDFSVFTLQVFQKEVGDSTYQWIPQSKKPLEDFLAHVLPWQTMQPIWKKEFMLQLGGFDEDFQRLQDVELHTRALLVKGVNYSLVAGSPDCYFRIDEARKNFNAFDFMERWVNSAIQYCNKFNNVLPGKSQALLAGTIYQTYLQVILHYRQHKLQKDQFKLLEEKLYNQALIKNSGFKRKLLLLSRLYNLRMVRIPGINKLIKKLITS